MASNFQLFLNQNRDSLHCHLCGDFDGMSAHELIHALKKHGKDYLEVFIDTRSFLDYKTIETYLAQEYHIKSLQD